MVKKPSRRLKYMRVRIPKQLADDINKQIKDLGYWPDIAAFVREASLEKLRRKGKPINAELVPLPILAFEPIEKKG